MGLLDSIKNLITGVSEDASSTASDALGGLTDNQVVQDIQDQTASIADAGADTATSASESGQAIVDDVSQNLGL